MYSKLFSSMFDGTLVGNWKALVTFQQLLILADQDGLVDLIPQAIAARTGIPLEILADGIQLLEAPDPYSRTPDAEGRRIERLDAHRPWGWRIVNFRKYRDLHSRDQKRAADRERMREKRSAERDESQPVATCRAESQPVADVAHTYTYTEAKKVDTSLLRKDSPPSSRKDKDSPVPSGFHAEVVALWGEMLPQLSQPKTWTEKRRRHLDARIRDAIARQKPADTLEYWRAVFGQVAQSPFLLGNNGRGWKADLPWLIESAENFARVIEGRYDGEAKHGR